MKIKFLKDFENNKKDSTADVRDWRANYWIRVGVAEEVKEKKVSKKEDKNGKPKSETK